MPLVFFIITSFFKGLFADLLPYMKCLLYGYNSIHNLAMSGDRLFSLNTESCQQMHGLLERVGRGYASNLVKILSSAVMVGLVKRMIDLSVDGFHMPYDGKKRVKDWGTPFSTMMNRPYPGLYPLTAVDLASGLILYAGSFVRAGAKECKKHLGDVVAPRVMECVDLLKEAGISVRSVIADEGITSRKLVEDLLGRAIGYAFALRANSKLRVLESFIQGWKKLDSRRFIGMIRNATYDDNKLTNLVMIKHGKRRYLYISSFKKGARYVWKRFCARGNHERRHGVASAMGAKSLPSNMLFQIKGHMFTVVYLNLILRQLCRELNLGDIDVETLRSMFTRECYVTWDGDGKMHALIVANKALLKKLGDKHKITWTGGTIEFIYYREKNAPKIGNGL